MSQSVFILAINLKCGTTTYSAHTSEYGAFNALARYVEHEWEKEMGKPSMPIDVGHRVKAYFEKVTAESYVIDCCELEED